MRRRLFEIGTLASIALCVGFAQQLSTFTFDSPIVHSATQAAVGPSGAILIVDPSNSTVKEVKNGQISERIRPSLLKPRLVAFSPLDDIYVLSEGGAGFTVEVYDSAGQKTGAVSWGRGAFFPVGFQVNSQNKIVLLRDCRSTPTGDKLIYIFDRIGNLVASIFPNPAEGGDRRDTPRIVVGKADEMAVFIPELRAVYWLDQNGNQVRRASPSLRVTAIGLVAGELWVAAANETPRPSSRPGVYSAMLSEPVLYRFPRTGVESQSPLPKELAGINHIDGSGNLIRVTSSGVTTFRP